MKVCFQSWKRNTEIRRISTHKSCKTTISWDCKTTSSWDLWWGCRIQALDKPTCFTLFGEKRNHEHFSWSFAFNLLELSSSRWSWCREKSTDFWGVIALFQSFGCLQKKLRYTMRLILEMRVGQQSSILLLFELPAKMLRQRSTNMSWALLNWSRAPFQKNFISSKSRFLANLTPQQKKHPFYHKKHWKKRGIRGGFRHPPLIGKTITGKISVGKFPSQSDSPHPPRSCPANSSPTQSTTCERCRHIPWRKKTVLLAAFFLKKAPPKWWCVCVSPFLKKNEGGKHL